MRKYEGRSVKIYEQTLCHTNICCKNTRSLGTCIYHLKTGSRCLTKTLFHSYFVNFIFLYSILTFNISNDFLCFITVQQSVFVC